MTCTQNVSMYLKLTYFCNRHSLHDLSQCPPLGITCICRFGWRYCLVILNSHPHIFTTSLMKMLISCLLKSTVYIKYFESDFLEKFISILKETLQIKLCHQKKGHNPPCYGNWKCPLNLHLAKWTFIFIFLSFLWHEILILMFNMFIYICECWNARGHLFVSIHIWVTIAIYL